MLVVKQMLQPFGKTQLAFDFPIENIENWMQLLVLRREDCKEKRPEVFLVKKILMLIVLRTWEKPERLCHRESF
ncbi:hypothetical protein [Deinococcus roseus]|uniref:hypothetical protein n=1 Tax=Deinococcus roseus TaxID=392414 RepID=UPI0016632A87|nr:hypothetical protein [Deinococcus roseus]